LTAAASEFPVLEEYATDGSASEVRFLEVGGNPLGELLGASWAALSCLPAGEWGEAVVVLGREFAPPLASARLAVQLSALVDGVRLVLAAHALNEGIVQAHRTMAEAQEKALRSEKLAVVGTLAASTAHDIRNITASLAMLAAEGGDPAASLRAVREQLDRFNVLAHRLLSYARPGQTQSHPVDLPELLERVLELTAGQMRVSQVGATLDCEPNLPRPLGDVHQLHHLFVNVVLNAVQAMERTGGHLRLEARRGEDRVEIAVVDDGPGIPHSIAERLFQPFASSRAQGFGLGLFSAKRIAEAHGGTIAALSNPEGGTTVLVKLPLAGGER
jgi:signal transduction histidine kinase